MFPMRSPSLLLGLAAALIAAHVGCSRRDPPPAADDDAASAPAPSITASLDGALVPHRVAARKICYEPYAHTGPATIMLELTVGADGAISSATALRFTGDPTIAKCHARIATGWRMPASGSSAKHTVPFVYP